MYINIVTMHLKSWCKKPNVFSAFLTLSLFLLLVDNVSSKHLTPFDDFCVQETLYKPYIKYYHGRIDAITHGVPFKTHPPGFYTDIWDEDMQNIYICINGPAWLYYKLTTATTEVYEKPELRWFIHECIIANGLKGPGPHVFDKQLLAIMLVGDAMDYRLPNIQLFTAPYQCIKTATEPCNPPRPLQLINTTSLMMIGDDTECILNKGKAKTSIRIRTDPICPPAAGGGTAPAPPPPPPGPPGPGSTSTCPPKDEDTAGTYCKLSYRLIESQVSVPKAATGSAAGPAVPDKTIEKTIAALKNDDTISIQGCYVPNIYTKGITGFIIDTRVTNITALVDPTVAGGTFDLTTYFTTAIPDYNKLQQPADIPAGELSTPAKISEAKKALKVATDADKKAPTYAADLTKAKDELTTAYLKNYRHNAFKIHKALTEATKALKALWADAAIKKTSDDVATAETLVTTTTTDKEAAYLKFQEDPTTKDDYDKTLELYNDAVRDFKAKSRLLAPLVAEGEILRLKYDLAVKNTQKAFDSLVSAYKAATNDRNPGFVEPYDEKNIDTPEPLVVTIKRDTATVPTGTTGPEKYDPTKTCAPLPKPRETCAKGKPEQIRACQLLMARVGNFKNGDEEITWGEEDAWRPVVLDLIQDIFVTAASPMLNLDFVTAVHRIMRGYLTDFIQETLPAAPVDPGASKSTRSSSSVVASAAPEADAASDPKAETLVNPMKPPKVDPPVEAAAPASEPAAEAAAPAAEEPAAPGNRKRRGIDSEENGISGILEADKISSNGINNMVPWHLKSVNLDSSLGRKGRGAFPDDPPAEPAAAEPASEPAAAEPAAAEPSSEPAASEPAAAAPASDPEPSNGTAAAPASPDVSARAGSPSGAAPIAAKTLPTRPRTLRIELPKQRNFWLVIIEALQHCKKRNFRLYFKKVTNGPREEILYFKHHPNGTKEDIKVEHFIEQADQEFAFNWAIDRSWMIFATVMGICMPEYETKIPLITSKFYTYFTEDFLIPLTEEWQNNRDNTVFQYILGEFYGSGTDEWAKLCMEASYIASGDVKYRPPRKVMVNRQTEANFFQSGPLAGTSGRYGFE